MADPSAAAPTVPIIPFLAAIFGAVIGIIGGYWARGLEGRKAEIASRVEDIVREVASIQAVAASYWSRIATDVATPQDISQEAELNGRLHVVNLLVEDVAPYLEKSSVSLIRSTVMHLRQTVTSGEFASAKGRQPSPMAINGVYTVGSALTMQTRKACRLYTRRWFQIGARQES